MKRFGVSVVIGVLVMLLGAGVLAEYPYTREPVTYGVGTGLYIPALEEALSEQSTYTIGNDDATVTLKFDSLVLDTLGAGGFTYSVYTATAEAEGDGAFTIDLNVPAGAILIGAQLRVDRLIEATTGVSWSAAFTGGSTATIATGQAFAQNTKASAFFDANGATAVTSDVTDIEITPNAGTLDEGFVTAVVTALVMETMGDTVAVTYSGETFSETTTGEGGIDNSSPITITLSGAEFAWPVGTDFVSSGYATVANLPSNLKLVASKTSATVLSVTITGTADSALAADDVSDLTLTFLDTAFAYGVDAADVVGYAKADLAVDFSNPTLTYSAASFSEAAENDGSIDNDTPVTITLSGDTYGGSDTDDFVDEGYITVTNLSTGLTAVATRTSSTVLSVTLTGNATAHADAQDVADLTFTFGNDAFTYNLAANVTNYAKANLAVDFDDPPTLTYSGSTFSEAVANDGSIDNSTPITITLAGDTLTGSDTDDFVDDGKIVVTNLSTGLTAVATRTSSTVLSITLTGNATSHANANDVADLTFTFQDTAFTTVDAANITNYAKADLAIDFDD